MSTGAEYLSDIAKRFHDLKLQAERAIAQASDEDLHRALDPAANTIGVLIQHLAGNMRSRWRDFLTTDGEKPDRHRDREFDPPADPSRSALMADWEAGWALLFTELGRLQPADLDRTVTARHEPMSVVSAINRQFGHAAQHIGQIVMIAKHFRSGAWQTLTIPRGQSEVFNQKMREKFGRQ